MVEVAAFAANAGAGTASCKNRGHSPLDQIGCQGRQAILQPVGPAVFDQQIAALDKTSLAETLAEPVEDRCNGANRGRLKAQIAEDRQGRLLRLR